MQTSDKPSTTAWRARCAEKIQVLVPQLDAKGAGEIAEKLHAVSSDKDPEEAAAAFMRGQQGAPDDARQLQRPLAQRLGDERPRMKDHA